MMVKLVESMGKEAFREGIQEYLKLTLTPTPLGMT